MSALVTADAETTVLRTHRFPSTSGLLGVRLSVRWRDPLPRSKFAFVRLRSSDANLAHVAVTRAADGPRLTLLDGSTAVATSPTPISSGVAYTIEWRVDALDTLRRCGLEGTTTELSTPPLVLSGAYTGGNFNALSAGAIYPPGVDASGMWIDAIATASDP